jgi:tRNA G46 methylase TrmB
MLEKIYVPANSSRYFNSQKEALKQPVGKIKITCDTNFNFYYNSAYDSSLIIYDSFYCTSDNFHLNDSIKIFTPLITQYQIKQLVEIGCGKGEFIKYLKNFIPQVIGFDPILESNNSYLIKDFFLKNILTVVFKELLLCVVFYHIFLIHLCF